MPRAPRSILMVIAPERFRDEELAEPRRALEAAGHRVCVASTRPGPASGMLGARVDVQSTVSAHAAGQLDGLVVVGGAGSPQHLWNHEPLLAMVRTLCAAGKPVAAICLSPPVLARAGALAGKRATTYPAPSALLELKRGGAIYVEEAVVRDGAVVTASGPEAAAAFGAALTTLFGE